MHIVVTTHFVITYTFIVTDSFYISISIYKIMQHAQRTDLYRFPVKELKVVGENESRFCSAFKW